MKYADELLIKAKDRGDSGVFASVRAAEVGWEYLNMDVVRLRQGERFVHVIGDNELVAVVLGGRCTFHTDHGKFENVGKRANVFKGMPHALYLPRRGGLEIEALSHTLEVALAWVPTYRDFPAKLVTPKDSAVEIRGGGNATRQINSIIPPGFECHRLVCVEVYTPSGNWSSYPPHKHDEHLETPEGQIIEADLEEIYFYKFDPVDGFAYQRVYTADQKLDALMMTRNHDTVLVPEGYHPVVSGHGYTTYYLNFLAGSAQSLANNDDPKLAWIKHTWKDQDPRLPLVTDDMA